MENVQNRKNRVDTLPGNDHTFHNYVPQPFVEHCIQIGNFPGFPKGSHLAFQLYAADLVLRGGQPGQFRHESQDPQRDYILHICMIREIKQQNPLLPMEEIERTLEEIAARQDSTIGRFTDLYEDPCFLLDPETGQVSFREYTNLERKLRDLDEAERLARGGHHKKYANLTPEGEKILAAIQEEHPEDPVRERLQQTRQERDLYIQGFPQDPEMN